MSRLPIRLRVTLTFALAMAVLLTGLGLFVYLRYQSQLNATIDQGLRSRADEVAALERDSEAGLQPSGANVLADAEGSFAQVLTADGTVFDTTSPLRDQSVLSAVDLTRALQQPTLVERSELPGFEGTARLLASPVDAQGQRVVVVVGTSLEERDNALSELAILLLIGGPAALLLASLAGYGAVTAALRPVEMMRRRANAISADEPDERLPLSQADDELHRLGETLNRMLDRLGIALERERAFVDDASHELRTPLSLHKTELELALRYGEDPVELKASIASAIEEVDRLIQLAEDMLVVARSEQGKLAVNLERVSAAALLEDVMIRFSARAGQANRELTVQSPATPGIEVEVDPLRIRQALTNMAENALRHGAGNVTLSAQLANDCIELHVVDNGPGFSPEFIDRAFERFTRADEARGRGGTGLGLAIVTAIARAHRGSAGARNRPGGGADVWLTLPQA